MVRVVLVKKVKYNAEMGAMHIFGTTHRILYSPLQPLIYSISLFFDNTVFGNINTTTMLHTAWEVDCTFDG